MRRLGFMLLFVVAMLAAACSGRSTASTLNPAHHAAAASARGPEQVEGPQRADGGRSSAGDVIAPSTSRVTASAPRSDIPSVTRTQLMTVYRNVRYGAPASQPLYLDAYVPNDGIHPAVVVIHGGGWATGDKQMLAFEGEDLAASGYAAFVIDYRMAPPGGDWHAPIALQDARSAVTWVRANAARYRVDPAKVGALGNSAGGNLAMMLGTTGTSGADRVEAVVSLSGQSELLKLSTPHTIHAATNYLGCAAKVCPAVWTANSPIAHVDHETAPMLLINSAHELMPLNQATDMAKMLQRTSVPHQLITLDGSKHASACFNQVWPRTLAFLRQYLSQ